MYVDTSILSNLEENLCKRDECGMKSVKGIISEFSLEDKIVFGSDYSWTKIFNTSPEKERYLLLNSNLSNCL